MQNQNIARKGFDYNGLSDKATRATLRSEATAIKAAVKRTHDNIIEIGNRLIHAQEVLNHGQFLDWIDAEFGMGKTMAYNFIGAAKSFSNFHFSGNLGLSQTAIFALSASSVSDETRGVALEMAASGDLRTTADAKALIEAAKPVSAPAQDADDLGDDPFADEDEPAPTDPPSEYFDDDEIAEASDSPASVETTIDTLSDVEAARENAAQRAAEGDPERLDDARWLLTLPAFRWLQTTGNRGILFKRAALDWRIAQNAIEALQKSIGKGQSLKMADNSPFSRVLLPLMSLKHPRFWRICGGCKGTGCARCSSTGYDLAAGLDAAVLLSEGEEGE